MATTLLYPWAFHWLFAFRSWAIAILVYRNILLVRIWCDLTFRREEVPPDPRSPPLSGSWEDEASAESNLACGSSNRLGGSPEPPEGDASAESNLAGRGSNQLGGSLALLEIAKRQ
jgi:hypothetical protein